VAAWTKSPLFISLATRHHPVERRHYLAYSRSVLIFFPVAAATSTCLTRCRRSLRDAESAFA